MTVDAQPRRRGRQPAGPNSRPRSQGVTAALRMFAKNNPKPASAYTDVELLTFVLGSPVAARSVMEACDGSLANLDQIGDAVVLVGRQPGVGLATALRVEALFEIALRILGSPPATESPQE